jgi:murein L,D-transpeptidase YafK
MADRHGSMIRSLAFAFALVAASAASARAQLGVPVSMPGDSVDAPTTLELAPTSITGSRFSLAQLQYERVRDARLEVRYGIKKLFRDRGLRYPAADIYLRVFKREHALELWVRPQGDTIFSLLRTYDICAQSGELGPKRARGDNQVPEGFYTIDHFNPYSDYHLSLHVDYPNRSDQLTSVEPDLGGEIFIHGGCNSIGCLALTDEGIKQLYWVAVEARAAGQQRIPIDIYPARLGDDEMTQLSRVFSAKPSLVAFWKSLKPGYDYFEKNRILPNVRVDAMGRYVVDNMAVPGTDTRALPGAAAKTQRATKMTKPPLGTPLGAPLGAPIAPASPPDTTRTGTR